MQDNNSLLRQYGAKYGLILGAILMVIGILDVYYAAYMGTSIMSLFIMLYIVPFVIKLVLAVVFVLWLRKTLGGYWTLKQATTGIFFLFYMAFLISFIGNDVIFAHFADPAAVHKANAQTVEYYRQAQVMAHITPKEVDKRVKDLDANLNGAITPGAIIFYIIRQVIIIFVVSLIFGAIFKQEPPMFVHQQREK